MRSFASDNNSSVHPRIMEALMKANNGHALGYMEMIRGQKKPPTK